MAKSIRSKWRRKCRAIKRERYGKKELERLERTVARDPHNKPKDIEMGQDLSEICTVVDKTAIKSSTKEPQTASNTDRPETVTMEVDGKQRVFNSRTMKDQNGTYPVWMHPRKVHKNKSKGKGKKPAKRIKKKRTKS